MPLIQKDESLEAARRVQKVMDSLQNSYPQLVAGDGQKEFVRRLVVLHDQKDEQHKKNYRRLLIVLTAANAAMLTLTIYLTFFQVI